MNISRRIFTATTVAASLTVGAASCGGSKKAAESARSATGPIKIWLSNNEQEIAWGKAVVKAWNTDHPDEKVSAQEIPAGKSSEEAITAAITAGTTPDLVFNISTAASPAWVKQGGLVDLTSFEDGASYIEARSGKDVAQGYADADGKYFLLPWKSNPVMVMYNKGLFKKAGINPEKPDMSTFEDFLAGAKKIIEKKVTKAAIWPAPTSEFFQSWFDYYPVYIAQTDGTQLVEDEKATFVSDDGMAVADFWASIYKSRLAPKEASTDDAMAKGDTAMQMAGPWAIASYKDAFEVGFMPVPTASGANAEKDKTFADSKNVSLFTTSKNQKTAWEFLKFATSKDQDGKLLEGTGQMPLRQDLEKTYPDYFEKKPEYRQFASLAARTVDVPNVPNSVEVWQKFRDAYSSSVIFGKKSVHDALETAADAIDKLVKG